MPRDARDAALESLLLMERRGAWSDGSVKRIAAQSGLDARDAALCTRLTYGVVQNRTLLDYYIDSCCGWAYTRSFSWTRCPTGRRCMRRWSW